MNYFLIFEFYTSLTLYFAEETSTTHISFYLPFTQDNQNIKFSLD